MRSKPNGKGKATTCAKRNVARHGIAKLKQRNLSQMQRRQRKKKNVERGKRKQPCSQQPGDTRRHSPMHPARAHPRERELGWPMNREDASYKASSLSLEEGEVEVAGMGEAAITGEDGTLGESEPKVAPT